MLAPWGRGTRGVNPGMRALLTWGGGGGSPPHLVACHSKIFFLLVEAPRFSSGKSSLAYLSGKLLPIPAPETLKCD